MKKILSLTIALISFNLHAQDIEFGISSGTGFAYIVENSDKSVDVNYRSPFVISSSLKYIPKNSNLGLKLVYQNLESKVHGVDWQYGSFFRIPFEGSVENRTLVLGIEYIKEVNKLNFGYHIGVGHTNERINFDQRGINYRQNSFMVLNLGGLMQYSLTQNLSLTAEQSFLWNDPIRSFSNYYKLAGEDLSFLIQIGIKYKIK